MTLYHTEDNLTTCAGYEIDLDTSTAAKVVLRTLRKNGVVIFETDDGEHYPVLNELEEIAGAIGLEAWRQSDHRLILIDVDHPSVKTIRKLLTQSDWKRGD